LGDFGFSVDKLRANAVAKGLDVAVRVICAPPEASNRVLFCIFDPQPTFASFAVKRCVLTFGLRASEVLKHHLLQLSLFEPIGEQVALEFRICHGGRQFTPTKRAEKKRFLEGFERANEVRTSAANSSKRTVPIRPAATSGRLSSSTKHLRDTVPTLSGNEVRLERGG
jgi:hypothetical protein